QFVRLGLERGTAVGQQRLLSEIIRAHGDVLFYRHWHGPLYYYALIAIAPLHLNERGTRTAMLVFPLFAGWLMYWGVLWSLPARFPRTAAAAVAAALFCSSLAVVTTTDLGPHQLFVLWAVATLL